MLKPISEIKSTLGINPNGRVQKYFTQLCYNHMDKYVPKDTGNLASNVELTANSITYKSPYAHYMYEGKVMGPNIPIFEKGVDKPVGYFSPKGKPKYYTGADIQYKNAQASSHWDKKMVSAEMRDIERKLQKYVDRGA